MPSAQKTEFAESRLTKKEKYQSSRPALPEKGVELPPVPQRHNRPHREKLPRPDLPANHSKNQIQPLFAARVEPDMKDRIDAWIAQMGWSKRQATEYAFEMAMRNTPRP